MTDQPPTPGHDDPKPTPPDAPAAGTPADQDGPIDLEPLDQPARGKPKIDAPGLIDDFDEDADFESDPEVERVVRGIPVEKTGPSGVEQVKSVFKPTGEPLCESVAWKVPGITGAAISLLAAVLAGVYADHSNWAYVLRTIYWAVLHSATGLGALVLSTFLLGRRVGSFEGAAARMLLAVSLYLAVYSLDLDIVSSGKLEEVILAAAAYFGGLVVAFRLAPRDAAVIGAAHFGVVMLLVLGGMLHKVILTGGAA
ncbi:MAG: hypothetical protein HND58_13470 [Planctomycetota bacterium]|nr:MAG: hypothetical protein HND58_13470 [Planctomycetota bacterium]